MPIPSSTPTSAAPLPASIQVLGWTDCLQQAEPEWLQLWERTQTSPDLSPMWARALVAGHQIDPDTLHVVTARIAGQLVMVWPLQAQTVRKLGLPCRQIGPLQNIFCMHGGLLTTLDDATATRLAFEALRSTKRLRWDWLLLENQVMDTPLTTAWLSVVEAAACPVVSAATECSPYLQHQGSLDELLAARSRNFREKMRARLRDLQRDPLLQLDYLQQPEDMPRYVDSVLAIERKSWKHAAGSAITSRDWETRFYEHLLAQFAPRGTVVAAVLSHEGTAIAHSLDLVHHGRVYGLKWSFDLDHAKRRPGVVMMVNRLSKYFGEGCTEFDFLGKNESYKLQWSKTTRDHAAYKVYAPGLRGRLLHGLDRARAALKARQQAGQPEPAAASSPEEQD
ncbi:MAG: GNAT family N-acetyltransferase [Burkholderiales bacterium]